ncbi:MAG: type II toxin-antitoxin system VapC family toxin [Limisphaerales bacterium]
MPPAKPKYYWDSCIFIAWIKDEKRSPGEMEGLAQIVNEVDDEKAVLMTSTISLVEVLAGDLTEEQKERYESSLKKPTIVSITPDARISAEAGRIRDFYRKKGWSVSLEDAIHLVSALLWKADELHTFDEKLLRFNGDVMGRALRVCKPQSLQGALDLKVSKKK